MRRVVFVLLMLLFVSVNAQQKSQLNWLTNYELVLKKAKKNKKPILVYFSGSDWCSPCKRLKKDLFDSEKFTGISKQYNLLYVDIPQKMDVISKKQYDYNKQLLQKLNPNQVFPLVMILNKKGKIKKEKKGYSSIATPDAHLNMLKEFVQ